MPVGELREPAPQGADLAAVTVCRGTIEHARIGFRIEGQAVLVIEDGERPVLALETQLQLPLLEHDAVWLAEHGHQHFALERRIRRVPLDVEVVCIH